MLNTQSEGQSTTSRSDQCELEIQSDLPIPNQNVQSTLQPVGFAPKPVPYPNYAVHGGNGTMMALPPMIRNKRRKKKCIIVSIISVIIITAIILAIHFYAQWVKNAPCRGIPGCHVIKTLGSGTFGDVYHVQVSGAEPPDAALKVFKDVPGSPNTKEHYCNAEKSSLLEIAGNEPRHGSKLQICHVREDIPGVDCPRVMLEYIDGPSIEKLVEFRGKPMSELVDFSISMMEQMNDKVLKPMHKWGMYHGDIKTGNIVYEPNDKQFHAVDFGLTVSVSRLPDRTTPQQREFHGGTLLFVSKMHRTLYQLTRPPNPVELRKVLQGRSEDVRMAERYSLAMSAIIFIGENCAEPEDKLCMLGKNVVATWNELLALRPNACQEFLDWDERTAKTVMGPLWTLIREAVVGHENFACQNRRLMNTFWNWEVDECVTE